MCSFQQAISYINNLTEAALHRCYKKVFWKYAANLHDNTYAEMWFQKQLYWNHTSAWVFSGKFAAYFQNTFL